jgi:hypothetical protein
MKGGELVETLVLNVGYQLRATPRKKAIKFSRHNVYARDRRRCQYCGVRVGRDEFSKPVRPKSLPDIPREFRFTEGMPEAWRAWIRDAVYWDGKLDTN